jgi:hypothetical protein
MRDKLKRVFAGKPWTQKQIADWERTRGKGRAMYVARFTLWWSTMTVILFSLGFHYLGGAPFGAKYLLVNALIWYPYGFLVGLLFWSAAEKKYRESLNATNEHR